MAFRNILFPLPVTQLYGSKPCVRYATNITSKGDGNEARVSLWGPNGRQYYEMSAFIMDEANYQAVLAFWHNVQGRAYSFRFIDTGDCAGLNSTLDTSAGGTTFQLRKAYTTTEWLYEGSTDTPATFTHYRNITLPDPSTVFLKLNGEEIPVAQNPSFNYLSGDPGFNPASTQTASVDKLTGIVTLSQSISSSDELVASAFKFHVKCRFDTDVMEPTYQNFQAYQGSLPLIEVYD